MTHSAVETASRTAAMQQQTAQRACEDAVVSVLAAGYRGNNPRLHRIAITWPSATERRGMLWGAVTIRDAETREVIPNVIGITVHGSAQHAVEIVADLEIYTDADGRPLPEGAGPLFTDAYLAWIGAGMPEGAEPASQVRTGVLRCVVEAMDTPPVSDPAQGRVPLEYEGWFAWVEHERVELVTALLRAGFRPLTELPDCTPDGENRLCIPEPADLEQVRAIFAGHGVAIGREERCAGIRTYYWPGPEARGEDEAAQLARDTQEVLGAFADFVRATDRYPTKDSLGDARTLACLEHALELLETTAAPPAC